LSEIAKRLKAGNIAAPVNAIDSVHTCEIIHALYQSDEQRKWVAVGESSLSARLGVRTAKL
jgi:hypothetical protein